MSLKKMAIILPLKLTWFTTKHTTRLSYKFVRKSPSAAMLVSALGLVACTSDNTTVGDSVRNGVDYVTPSNPFKKTPKYSPYGGTDKPSSVKIGRSYNIKGVRYQPKYEPDYTETGTASWYGPNFHGRQTANGERYNQYAMTAAHRTLPLPSMVRVTRTDTGESIVVRVNDRGPFAHGRIIDLSKKAAQELNMIGSGVAPVKVEYLPNRTIAYLQNNDIDIPDYMQTYDYKVASYDDNQVAKLPRSYKPSTSAYRSSRKQETYRPEFRKRENSAVAKADVGLTFDQIIQNASQEQTASTTYNVQTAAFANKTNAERHMEKLEAIGRTRMQLIESNKGPLYRVMVGPVKEYEQAVMLMDRAQQLGIEGARIVID